MKKCLYCGAQIADDSRFCTECGKKVMQAGVCPHCGAGVGDSDVFCRNCGKNLNEVSSSEPIDYEGEEQKSGFKKFLPYLVGMFLLLMIIGYWFSNHEVNSSNGNVVETDSKEVISKGNTEDNDFTGDDIKGGVEDNNVGYDDADDEYEEELNGNQNVDVSSILNECQAEITSIQREIESACSTFALLASDDDIDMMKYGRMKIAFINGVNDLVKEANKAFDKCANDLKMAGVKDAESAVNQEKRQFNNAINELKSRTLQQVDVGY